MTRTTVVGIAWGWVAAAGLVWWFVHRGTRTPMPPPPPKLEEEE